MNKAGNEKKLTKDAYTVENSEGQRFRIRPVTDGFTASALCEHYYSTTQEQSETLQDGSTVYYDGEWFFIRDYGNGKQVTIAVLTAL